MDKEDKNITIEEGVIDALELLISHYRYGVDGESSTVLCDIDGRIVAFFDRGSERYQIIRCEGIHRGKSYYSLSGEYGNPVNSVAIEGNETLQPSGGSQYFSKLIKEKDAN